MNKDSIVIGGGIIGMMTALELAKSGHDVVIIERGKLGMASSWAAGGILSSMRPWSENEDSYFLSEQGKTVYPNYVDDLVGETGIDVELLHSGLLVINQTHCKKLCEWANKFNINIENSNPVSKKELNIPEQAILMPDIMQIRPPLLITALYESLKKHSVTIVEETEISRLEITKNKFNYVESASDRFYADNVIITAGSWSSVLINEISIKPVRGQMLCLNGVDIELQHILLDDDHYLIPRSDNRIIVGSTMEDTGFNNDITTVAREELMTWTTAIAPALANANIEKQWSGLRPATIRGKPYIGAVPDVSNMFINAGHFRKGILQAPASAKLLTDCINGQDSFMDISRFSIN